MAKVKNLPAEKPSDLPAELVDEEFALFEGDRSGLENVTAADVVIPRMTILQKLSPQLDRSTPSYIEGAQEGDFCNTATGEIFRGEILIIPCHFVTRFLEWKPKRGGLAGIHNDDQGRALMLTAKPDEKRKMILPNGNALSETAQYYCLQMVGGLPRRIFIPLSSTQLKHSRKWMTLITGQKAPVLDKQGNIIREVNLPIYYRAWTASPVEERNAEGTWRSWKFTPNKPIAGPPKVEPLDATDRLLREAREYYKDASEGVVTGELVEDDGGSATHGQQSADTPL